MAKSHGSEDGGQLAQLVACFHDEVDRATKTGQHIHPKTLTATGDRQWAEAWPELLKESVTQPENVRWLTHELFARRFFVRGSAAEQVAEHHFIRFFSAAVCRVAIDAGAQVHYVRFRASQAPRGESERLLEQDVHENPTETLAWLRSLDGFHHSPLGRYRTGLMLALEAR